MDLFNELQDSEITNVENQKNIEEQKEYSPIIEIASIISNNDPQVIEDVTLLATDIKLFIDKYSGWCRERYIQDKGDIVIALIALLTGDDTEYTYGHYCDWREDLWSILDGLEIAIEKLGYPLTLNDIEFADEESTSEALEKINEHFMKSGYTLFDLYMGSDSYQLFITPMENFNRVCELGEAVDFNVCNTYQ